MGRSVSTLLAHPLDIIPGGGRGSAVLSSLQEVSTSLATLEEKAGMLGQSSLIPGIFSI